jgi:hypothetical protein
VIKKAAWAVAIPVFASAAALGWAYSGQYNVAADAPHWDVTTRVLASVRERSIEARAADLTVPNLADPALIALGAEHYAGMCTGCHLAPGVGDNEMRQGLYPQPPNLSDRRDRSPAESFWIIKHGLKMSGMPAWGVTMDAAAYAALTQDDGEADHDHEQGGAEHDSVGPVPAASATMGATAEDGHAHVHAAGEGHEH